MQVRKVKVERSGGWDQKRESRLEAGTRKKKESGE
jgi:hypothetical protein